MSSTQDILCPKCRGANRFDAQYCQHCGHDVVLNNDIPSDEHRYVITRIIKAGGQGAVYAGVNQRDGRIYAIKEMLDNFTDPTERDDAIKRFNDEAKLLKGLNHPCIPRVYSHFTDEGRHYLTMDLVQGEDLQQIVERQGALPEAQVLEWALQICEVLAYIHANNLIYRDMKPSNVMVEADGRIKLVDFGIAKFFKPQERGTQIGTPGYAPPEQYQGIATRSSDIYALGATLHHLLTGRDPTEHAPFSFEPVRNLNVNVSRRTSDAIQKALSMEDEGRFATVVEFRAMLRPLSGTPSRLLGQTGDKTVVLRAGASQAQPAPQAVPPPPSGPMPPPAPRQPTTKPPQQPPPPQHPQPLPQTKKARKKKRGACVWFVALLLILGGLAIGAVMLAPTIQQGLTTIQATPVVPVNEMFETDVEVVVNAGTDDATIREAFLEAFQQKITATYGDDVSFNRNISPFVARGSSGARWEEVDEEHGRVRYLATMRARVRSE